MPPRLTPARLTALRDAAVRSSGTVHPMLVGEADVHALELLGLVGFLDACGHRLGEPDPDGVHRGHPHLLRLTAAGIQAARAAGGPLRARRGGRPLPSLVSDPKN
ncbi:hypothetical protein [Streptomyces sp. WM6378]|uniref:hypothetical protein n=1 Tax=Streptomyces sp. WM6378 TaxID=1415557 RepID=UPI0006AD9442|nr:hypothetical protein [Streptomyces sp. WM6378]KOU43599.1 hypothetical protein ADK54_17560 [Streptomyces sp. WM6378]